MEGKIMMVLTIIMIQNLEYTKQEMRNVLSRAHHPLADAQPSLS